MPERNHAQHLIVGGGIIGCSIAYHLTAMGAQDVVILEKSDLTHGATWHAAGLVGQLRSSRNTTRMLKMSVELYDKLEAETGQAVDWKKVGSLRLASSPERLREIKQLATTAKSFGLEMEIVSAAEAQELFKGARDRGAKILRGVRVEDVRTAGRRVTEVVAGDAVWTCETFINAAGMWSRELGRLSDVAIPACALEHQYIITDPIPDMPRDMPSLRDPDRLVYYKPEVRGLLVGGYEPNTLPFGDEGVPRDFARELLPGNFDRFEQLATLAAEITPIINEVGIRELINGPIPYSADGDFVMGKVPELDNYFVASGFLYGIAAGGGAGRMMAEWILEGAPSLDLWPLDVRRFSSHHNTSYFMYRRAVDHYGHHYRLHFPGGESSAARGIRRSPLYYPLKEMGAVFGARAGWERPNWFAPKGIKPSGIHAKDEMSFERAECNWFPHVAAEHKAVRERVALIDQTSFAKMEITGPGALDALQRLAVSNLDRPPGSVVYTQLCNERGGIECDLTISRLDDERFYLITGSAFGTHDFNWIARHLPIDASVLAREVTSAYAVLNICGPRAREVLSKVTDADLSNEAFAFSTCRTIELGAARVLAVRIGYVGELGWELHIPSEFAPHVYELLWRAGRECGIANAGYRAIDSLRMEKGYLYWSADITPDYTPFEAGLGPRVHLASKGDFIGRAALEKAKAEGPRRKLSIFSVDEPVSLYGGETIYRDGRYLGLTTSGNHGHSVDKAIAMGYLPIEETEHEIFEIEAFGERHAARRHECCLYDPDMTRLKASTICTDLEH
jgi:4-methylaminobutanoate oxidase (formaldehyde-forming)